MPKVKKKAAKKNATAAKPLRAEKRAKRASPIAAIRNALARYSAASLAGAAVILALFAVVLLVGGYVGKAAEGAVAMTEGAVRKAGFEVKRVTLKGAHQTAHDEILAAIGPVVGRSTLHVDLEATLAKVEALGWVRSAAVSRLLPDTLHISVREREPAAIWQVQGRLHLTDDTGATIREIGAYEYSYLPLIVGAGAPEAAQGVLAALSGHPALEERTYALVRVGERRWNMRLRNGIDVKLPETDYQGAIEALGVLQAAHQLLDQKIEYIDLRDPERMVVRRPGDGDDADLQQSAL